MPTPPAVAPPPAPFSTLAGHPAIELPGARALFTTRRGGASEGPWAGLNLGPSTGDHPGRVARNRATLAALTGVAALAWGRQVHGARVRRVLALPAAGDCEADGQATALPGVAAMVTVADCLPIALAAPGAVAMVHAGWRGLAAGVVAEGVRALRELGAVGPVCAAIGPGARGCCYRVGPEVHAAFVRHGPDVRDGALLDLPAVARRELDAVGVATVHDARMCTLCCEPGLLYSHRRDGPVTGRQAGVVWLT